MYLFFDTETTGLPAYGRVPLEQQPYVVQFAASLYDEERRPVVEVSCLVANPTKPQSHPKALETHGITPEMCEAYGFSPKAVASIFDRLIGQSRVQVAHNAQFDQKLMNFLYWRLDAPRLQLPNLFCTCDAATPIVNLPPTEKMVAAGRTEPKRASLLETHMFLFGEGFEGAHDALIDTRACARVYFELLDRGLIPRP